MNSTARFMAPALPFGSVVGHVASIFILSAWLIAPPLVAQGQWQSIESEELEEPSAQPPPPPATVPTQAGDGNSNAEPLDPALAVELRDLERLAEESFAQDDLVTASALYRQLADRHVQTSEKTRIMMVVAWLQHQQARPNLALGTLTEVLVLNPDYQFRPDLYSEEFAPIFYDAQKRALQTRRADASRLTREGSDLMRRRQYEEARGSFQQALRVWPEQVNALYNLALANYYQKRQDDALDGFDRLLALAAAKPDLVDPRLKASTLTNAALIYIERDQMEEAGTALEQAVALDPKNATAWLNLGVVGRRQNRPERASEAFRTALKLDPTNIDAGRNLGRTYLDSGQAQAAADLLQELTSRAENDAGLWLYLGMAKKALGDHPGAGLAFEATLARDPDNQQHWAGQAALQLAAQNYLDGDFHGTRRQAERVVQWLPEKVNGWVYLGLAFQGMGDLEAARQQLENALRLAPTRADIYNSLGSVDFGRGDYAAAEQSFLRALELEPNLADAQRNLDATRQVRGGKAVAGRGGSNPARRPGGAANRQPRPATKDFGFTFSKVDYRSLGLQGVMIEAIKPSSAADRSGLQANDLLLKMDGRPIDSADGLKSYLSQLSRSKTVRIELLRDNRPATATLTIP